MNGVKNDRNIWIINYQFRFYISMSDINHEREMWLIAFSYAWDDNLIIFLNDRKLTDFLINNKYLGSRYIAFVRCCRRGPKWPRLDFGWEKNRNLN